jgi:hypothetical protein
MISGRRKSTDRAVADTQRAHQRTTLLGWGLLAIVTYAAFSGGGSELLTQSITSAVAAVVVASSLLVGPSLDRDATRRVALQASLAVLTLAGYATLQASRSLPPGFEHEAWPMLREVVGPVRGAISVAPEQTWSAISALAPGLVFVAGLAATQRDEQAVTLLRRLCYVGAALAVFGFIERIVWMRVRPDADAGLVSTAVLDATFINRNSAGTLLGCATVLSVAFLSRHLCKVSAGDLYRWIRGLAPSDRSACLKVGGFAALAAANFLGLMLTQSRGAAGATLLALLLFWVLAGPTLKGSVPLMDRVPVRLRGLVTGTLVIGALYFLLGERVEYRLLATPDSSRWCIAVSSLAARRDNWPFGAGFAAFADVFPAYRDAECAGVGSAFLEAHNSFLEGAVGMGLVFVVVCALAFAVLIPPLLQGLARRQRYRFVPAAGLAVLLLVATHSLVDFSTQVPGVSYYVAVLLAACKRRSKNPSVK